MFRESQRGSKIGVRAIGGGNSVRDLKGKPSERLAAPIRRFPNYKNRLFPHAMGAHPDTSPDLGADPSGRRLRSLAGFGQHWRVVALGRCSGRRVEHFPGTPEPSRLRRAEVPCPPQVQGCSRELEKKRGKPAYSAGLHFTPGSPQVLRDIAFTDSKSRCHLRQRISLDISQDEYIPARRGQQEGSQQG
jgi:hypothetical protein